MKRTNDVLVGLAVLVVAIVVSGATLWARQADITQRHRKVTARFHDVGNVRVGNAAVVRGVRAGRIAAIELADDGWVHVRLTLDPEVELPPDPVVLLTESSLFGEWQATIVDRAALPRDDAVRRQVAEASGGGRVLPGAALPDIAHLTTVAGQIAGDVANVAERVEVAFDDNAARDLRASIRNFAVMSATLAGTVRTHAGDIDSLTSGLQSAVTSLNRTATRVEALSARADSSVESGQMRQIVGDVGTAAAELRVTARNVRTLTDQLTRSQGHLDALIANSDSVMTKLNSGRGSFARMINDSSLYTNSDSLMVQLRDLVADIRANPRRYVNLRVF